MFRNLDNKVYHAGEFRTYNFTKDEPVLDGDTVDYQSWELIEESLKYDFNEEKNINYLELNKEEFVERITEFTSRVWQIHPFCEGNTRTTAVFIQKYLISMGFDINNDLFKDNSLYFRNALVRANYKNYNKGVNVENKYLKMFFGMLSFDKDYELNNDDLYINKN